MSTRIGLARKADNGAIFTTDLLPIINLTTINLGKLFDGKMIHRIVGIDDDSDGIARNDKFLRIKADFFSSIQFLRTDLT